MIRQQLDLDFVFVLKNVLNYFSCCDENFCIGGYTEDGICILKEDDNIQVFYGNCLDRLDLKTYPKNLVYVAGLDFLLRIIDSSIHSDVKDYYFNQVMLLYEVQNREGELVLCKKR